ncbi:MAG TPA: carbohydrate ABC transporter permease [Candidatus Solibacter sp.]|jgi:multiple sugar transport system permease protein|nr:carbohydrate ABC transporter permease [Candidatus Solibacter sp.]
MSKMKKPLGITIISILVLWGSLSSLIFAVVIAMHIDNRWPVAVQLLNALVLAGTGVGLWKLRNWARVVLILLLVLNAAVSLAAVLDNVLVQHDYKFAGVLFLLFSISVLLIYYVNHRSVQQAFASLSAWPTTIKTLVLAVFTVLLAFPFYWMVVATFKQNLDLYTVENNPFIFNANPTLDNLRLLFETRFVQWLGNTALVGVVVVAITLFLAVPAAYALARLTGRWGERLGIAIFLTYLVPPTLLFIPLARVVARLGLQDSIWALVLIYPSFTVPFSIWLLMGFFKSIPKELEDAAMVDGLTRFGAFIKMVIPISISGILTVVIFTFTLVTQEFVYALTFISSESKQMVGVGIPIFLVRGDVYFWGSLMAACLIASLPIAFLYNLFLDRFIAGFTVGAVKG